MPSIRHLILLLLGAPALHAEESWLPAWARAKRVVRASPPPPAPQQRKGMSWQEAKQAADKFNQKFQQKSKRASHSRHTKAWLQGKGLQGKGHGKGKGKGAKGGGGGGSRGTPRSHDGAAWSGQHRVSVSNVPAATNGAKTILRVGGASTAVSNNNAVSSNAASSSSGKLDSMPVDTRFDGLDKLLDEYVSYRERADLSIRAIRKELRALRRVVAKQQQQQQQQGLGTARHWQKQGFSAAGALREANARNACITVDSSERALPAWAHPTVDQSTSLSSLSVSHWRNSNSPHGVAPRTSLPKLHWLHMPKAGTSFMVTIIQYSCPTSLKRAYNGAKVWYPEDLYHHWFTKGYVSGAGCTFDWAMRTRCDVSPRFTWHHTALPWDAAGAKSDGVNISSLVTMLRKPVSLWRR